MQQAPGQEPASGESGESRPRRLFQFDVSLHGKRGHCVNKVLGFAEAAARFGMAHWICVPRTAEPDVIALLGARPLLPTRPLMFAHEGSDFLERLPEVAEAMAPAWEALEREGVDAVDIVLFGAATPAAIFDLGRWLAGLPSERRPAAFVRFVGPEFKDDDNRIVPPFAEAYRLASRLIAGLPGSDRIFFFATNHHQVDDIARVCGRRVFLFPLPMYYGNAGLGRPAQAPSVVYIHVVAKEHEDLAISLAELVLRTHRDVRIVLKCQRRGMAEFSSATLGKLDADRVTVIGHGQTAEEYLAMIGNADIVVQPYPAAAYRVRDSGVFCEAAALGKVIVSPADTWMAGEIEAGHAAGVLFDALSVPSVTAAVEQAIVGFAPLSSDAAARAPAFRRGHNCESNLTRMLELAASTPDMALTIGTRKPIDFTDGVVSRSFLGNGWSHTEPGFGVWSDGEDADLVLCRTEDDPPPGSLTLTVAPYLAGKHRRLGVDVLINGAPVANWEFTDPALVARTFAVPGYAKTSRELRVTFQIRHPASPRDLGLSSDGRALGLRLIRLVFDAEANTAAAKPMVGRNPGAEPRV